jgi:PST family polysaccharide transporter
MSSTPYNTQVSAALLQSLPQAEKAAAAEKHTYGQILKSSALIGGSSVMNIAFGIVRTKAMALMLGPLGVGFLGIYGSISDLTRSVAEMGINSSGVRQIAEAVGSGDRERIARTVTVLRRISVVLGIIGAVLLLVFCRRISLLAFHDAEHTGAEHTGAVALLSLAVLFSLVSDGQGALIQGMRRINDLARMRVLGALYGAMISIIAVYFLREEGIVLSLIGVAAMSILTSWWYSRKVKIQSPSMTWAQVGHEVNALLKLGFAFMASGFLTTGAVLAIRVIIVRKTGVEAAGLYQSAWVLGGLYVGFILQAMGADFYPRLTGIARDNAACNRLVNEQAQVSLLLAGPGVVATLTFAPVVIALFYTAKFNAAVDVLRWICFGMTLRVIAWPMGFIILAKGAQQIFFWTEVLATLVHVGLGWILIKHFGLAGAGMAFFGLYVWHGILIYFVVRRLSGFLPLIGIVFCCLYVLPFWWATGIGTLAVLVSGIYSLRMLCKLVPMNRAPRFVQRLLVRFHFAPPGSEQ